MSDESEFLSALICTSDWDIAGTPGNFVTSWHERCSCGGTLMKGESISNGMHTGRFITSQQLTGTFSSIPFVVIYSDSILAVKW